MKHSPPRPPTDPKNRETGLEKLLNQLDKAGQQILNGFWSIICTTIQGTLSTIIILKILGLLSLFIDNQYHGLNDCAQFELVETKYYICNFFVLSDFAVWIPLIALVIVGFLKTMWIILKQGFSSTNKS